jgi:hypothetical protein
MAENIDRAKAAVADLLKNLAIERVFCIDDVYSQEWKIEDIQAAQLELDPPGLLAIMPELGAGIPDDRAVRRQQFLQLWEKLEPAIQKDRAKKILELSRSKDEAIRDDSGVAATLQEIVGKDRLITLSPTAWEKEAAGIIAGTEKSRALVLFDQDLSEAGGSPTGGMALIKNLLADTKAGNLLCGLLTHTATMANQHERWEELSREPGVDRDRFVVVPKQWLSQDPVGFARMLKMVALSPDCQKLKVKIKALLNSAAAAAANQVDAISVFDFDHVVFRNSYEEGLWEPDALFRLHGIFHRTDLRKNSHGDEELSNLLDRLRTVSMIPTDSESTPSPSTWRLQQQEMYEPGEYINGLHLPIDVGDIFQKTDGGSTKSFILLGQPCDLMVRTTDGKRHPEITDVLLAEIATLDEQKPYTELLPYFGDDRSQSHYVMFRRVHIVDPRVLDLCVFNSDGAATIDQTTPCPSRLTPAWKKRFDVSRRMAKSILRRYATFAEGKVPDGALANVRSDLIKLFPPSVSNSGVIKATVELTQNGGQIKFNCKRTKRLSRQRAIALALQYSSCLSRPAFDRDLA